MLIIQTTEAKERLAELLRTVERGDTVAIARHGQTIAHVVPAPENRRFNYQEFSEKIDKIHQKWGTSDLSIEEIVRLKHAGHDR